MKILSFMVGLAVIAMANGYLPKGFGLDNEVKEKSRKNVRSKDPK